MNKQNLIPHIHAEWIKAKADGHTIQEQNGAFWYDMDADDYSFGTLLTYRVKPAEPEKVYPTTLLTPEELQEIWYKASDNGENVLLAVANVAIKHAINSGQVVTADEPIVECNKVHSEGFYK